MRYSLDTNSLIQPWNVLYPPRRFPSFWRRFEQLIDDGDAVAVDEVAKELGKKDDALAGWAKQREHMFMPLDAKVQQATREVLAKCPKLVSAGKGRDGADPFVIGLALAHELTVVTLEHLTGSQRRPRIPDVCRVLRVRSCTVLELIEAEDWQF